MSRGLAAMCLLGMVAALLYLWSDDRPRRPTVRRPRRPPSAGVLRLLMLRLLCHEPDIFAQIEAQVHQARLCRNALAAWPPRRVACWRASAGMTRLYWEWELAMDMWELRGYGAHVVLELYNARMAYTREWMDERLGRIPWTDDPQAAIALRDPTQGFYVPPKHALDTTLRLLDSRIAPDPITLEDYFDSHDESPKYGDEYYGD